MNPVIVRKIIYPAYAFIRHHNNVFLKLKELKKNQWLSRQELKDLQWKELSILLDYVYKNVPYYTQLFNELGLKPEDVQDPNDYSKIPILTKEIIRNNSNKMITTDPSRKGRAANTGGSTGETLYFYKDLRADSYSNANLIRLNEWCMVDIGDKEAVFWGTPFDLSRTKKISEGIKKYMKNILELSTFDMSERTLLRYVDTIHRFNPKLLRGYPSALFTFANFLKKNNITDIKPKVVISTGERSFPFQRELMEEVFGKVIFDRYGSNEFANMAHECANHHGLHIITDMYYIEFMKDNRLIENRETGEIIVTDLYNYYMPFLRYRIGDLGILFDIQCSCGRGFPLMEEVEGRSFDMIVAPSGKILGGFFWTYISRAVPGIKQFQIIQKSKDGIDFKIVPDSNFEIKSTRHLEKEIKEQCGQNFKVNFKITDEIPLGPSGKARFIISEVSKERLVMKSKIHKATVTEVDLNHIDSITVDEDLMKKVNLREYEKVLVVDNTSGARLETCVIKGRSGSGIISMNCATAHLIKKREEIIIMAFAWTDEEIVPQTILVDKENKFVQYLEGDEF